jgi:hypothetical protein
VRHSNIYPTLATTGSPTITNTGGYIYYYFNNNGSLIA